MFSKEVLKIVRRLQKARLELMKKQPFYAVLLLHMQFSLDPMCETAYTDGERIAFCPDFVDTLSDGELEFVLMHEVLHAALNHCNRGLDSYDYDDFNIACDIVVNSNILYSCGMDRSKITLKNYGESMHIAPDGKEGYEYSAEEVYELVHTMYKNASSKADRVDDCDAVSARMDGGFDDHTYWGSLISDSTDQDSDGGEGEDGSGDDSDNSSENNSEDPDKQNNATNPGHSDSYNNSTPDDNYSENEIRDKWLQRMIEATQIAERLSINNGSKNCGSVPLGAQRDIKKLTEPQTDWRTVLDMFIQEEITDYSFNPPDRRFQDTQFLLPDYNEKDESVKDVLFMIDTSGSMSDEMITQAYSEIYGAIQQFNGNLQGWLGFFDAGVVEPKEFTDEEELKIIRPEGGGGTNFHCIFEYVKEHIDEIRPANIIILTDGYAPWPEEDMAMDIPVLWLINNEESQPPWGKVTRIKTDT